MRYRIEAWRSLGCVLLLAFATLAMSCSRLTPDDETLIDVGLKDRPPPPKPVPPPPPPRWTVDVIIDAASSSAARPNIEEALVGAVNFVATQDSNSEIRLWVLDKSDAQLMNKKDAAATGRDVVDSAHSASHGAADATLRVERLLTALSGAPKVSVSPLAEALTKIGLSPPSDRKHWFIVVLTNGVQERDTCPVSVYSRPRPCQPRFNCAPPAKPEWFKYLDTQRLLPVGGLAGAEVVFAHFEPNPTRRCCADAQCLSSMAFVQALQDLWRGALAERGGAHVAFELRGPTFPKLPEPVALPPTSTKETP